jgi:DNA-binding transcriptional LysR family regulator
MGKNNKHVHQHRPIKEIFVTQRVNCLVISVKMNILILSIDRANTMKADLNLLLTLSILLEENSVSRTASRLNLSQPSVSARLERLREWLGDPLLIPTSRGMRPTVRGETLRAPLQQLTAMINSVTSSPTPFSPRDADCRWRVAATDYGSQTTLTPLIPSLRQVAPGTQLAIMEMKPAQIVQQLEKGEIDLVLHIREEAPEELHLRPLFFDQYVVAGRAGHQKLHVGITAEQLCSLEHVIVSPNGGGFHGVTDTMLEAAGLHRQVVLSVPHFLVMAGVLMSSDLVALIPKRLAAMMPGIITVPPPIDIPEFEMVMLWHERSHRDPAHQWLREQLYQHAISRTSE